MASLTHGICVFSLNALIIGLEGALYALAMLETFLKAYHLDWWTLLQSY